jgi:hypothetical protein
MLGLLVITFLVMIGFDKIYPYFFKNEERRIAKIVCQRKKPVDDILSELLTEHKKIRKEKILEIRRKKLDNLNKISKL